MINMTKEEALKFGKENILSYESNMADFMQIAIASIEKQIEIDKDIQTTLESAKHIFITSADLELLKYFNTCMIAMYSKSIMQEDLTESLVIMDCLYKAVKEEKEFEGHTKETYIIEDFLHNVIKEVK